MKMAMIVTLEWKNAHPTARNRFPWPSLTWVIVILGDALQAARKSGRIWAASRSGENCAWTLLAIERWHLARFPSAMGVPNFMASTVVWLPSFLLLSWHSGDRQAYPLET
mmetsp:Transcript_5967/g.9943  ORF Transcript_5967/g.9943 Transcript_5967/m.9943 type:complete len:110 (-) Transcript_5967:100-429(-)